MINTSLYKNVLSYYHMNRVRTTVESLEDNAGASSRLRGMNLPSLQILQIGPTDHTYLFRSDYFPNERIAENVKLHPSLPPLRIDRLQFVGHIGRMDDELGNARL